jgi:hypothetical protein
MTALGVVASSKSPPPQPESSASTMVAVHILIIFDYLRLISSEGLADLLSGVLLAIQTRTANTTGHRPQEH